MNYFGREQFKPGMMIHIIKYRIDEQYFDSPCFLDDKIGLVVDIKDQGVYEDYIMILLEGKIQPIIQSKCSTYEIISR